MYQELLLLEHFNETPSGPSIREQEEGQVTLTLTPTLTRLPYMARTASSGPLSPGRR